MTVRELKTNALRRARKWLMLKVRQASLFRNVYKNWFSILAYQSIRRERNVSRALLRSNHQLVAKGGIRFNNLFGLAQLIHDKWKVVEITGNNIVLEDTKSSLRMKCRINVGFDLSFLAFVFVERIYPKDLLNKTVIDAGSYIGDTAIYFAANGATRVIGLEPYGENLELARENVEILNKMGNRITLLQAALSTKEGQADFRVFESEPNGNRIASYSKKQGMTIKTRTMTIESIMSEFGLERVNVLKMNCEGIEYEVIESLSNRTASLIDQIYIEFHNGPERLIASLEKLGYKVEGGKRKNARYGHLRAISGVLTSPMP